MRSSAFALAILALLACGPSPEEPLQRCNFQLPNIRYDVPDTGAWKPRLLMRIEPAPDSQPVLVQYNLSRHPTTADSLTIVAYNGTPDWYWLSTGRGPMPVTMRAGDMRRFLTEVELDYVSEAVIPLGGCFYGAIG